jgi:lipopolysaccharide export system protein LptA
MFRRWFIKWSLSYLLVVGIIGGSGFARAGEIPTIDHPQEPISITSNKMTIKSLEDKIIFEGEVFIKRGDLTIEADRAEVFLSERNMENRPTPPSSVLMDPSTKGEREVSRIETSGNVDIRQGEKHAKAQKGVYDQKRETITLTGDAEAWEKDYRVKGKVITLFIAENRSLVEGSQVIIHSGVKDLNLGNK